MQNMVDTNFTEVKGLNQVRLNEGMVRSSEVSTTQI